MCIRDRYYSEVNKSNIILIRMNYSFFIYQTTIHKNEKCYYGDKLSYDAYYPV